MSKERPGQWPLSHQEFEQWVNSVPWQDAVTAVTNPHQYTLLRRTPDRRMFRLAVLYIREFGSEELYGGQTYTYMEASGFRFWSMGHALKTTILVNRKWLGPEGSEATHDTQEAPDPPPQAPLELYTSRFFNYDLLSSGYVIPCRISMIAPEPLIGEVPYPLEHTIRDLMPERPMIGKWDKYSTGMWKKLDHIGPERIGKELATISHKHDGKSLALLCFEDVTPARGHKCHRVVVSAWWYEQTGWKMPELTDTGEVLDLHQLHRQAQPIRPR